MTGTKHFTRFALTCAAVFALGAASMTTSCGENPGGDNPTTPVITITTQPTAPAALTEGAIPTDTKLTVVATVTEGATLTYQWYSNTTASNEGGTAIDGATAASYTLSTTLIAGTYYYFCEVKAEGTESKHTNTVIVTVNAEPVPVPVITITTQPTAPAVLTEGSITGSLTVEATVTEGATLTYQWYTNTTASNEGGTAIGGATSASFTLPTTLTAGTYNYFCELSAEGAESKRTNVMTITVTVPATTLNGRITWKDGKYALTTDPTDAGLLFKFGSVSGIFSGNGAALTLPSTASDSFDTGDIAWDPIGATDWATIPVYDDYPVDVDAAYHTIANVKAGKGDPCRLVGLDLNKIKNTSVGSLTTADIDNGLWRLPTNEENQSFSGHTTFTSTTAHWTTLNDVPGGMFPDTDSSSAATFLPATGYRDVTTGALARVGDYGYCWSGTPVSAASGYYLFFYASFVNPSNDYDRSFGYAVRCVHQ